MRGADESAEVRPASARRPSILIPTLVGLGVAVGGGFVIQDSCDRLLNAMLVRGATMARLILGVALVACGGAVLGLYISTAKLKANVNRHLERACPSGSYRRQVAGREHRPMKGAGPYFTSRPERALRRWNWSRAWTSRSS